MADTYTTSNRFEKMEPGQYLDTWGARWNAQGGSDLIDAALDGVESFALSGSKTLTNNNGAADEARKRILNVTGGTGGTITIPNVAKAYLVRNASSGDVIITTGSGTTATLVAGLTKWVFSTGSNVVYADSGPDFGSANIVTTGTLAAGATTITGTVNVSDGTTATKSANSEFFGFVSVNSNTGSGSVSTLRTSANGSTFDMTAYAPAVVTYGNKAALLVSGTATALVTRIAGTPQTEVTGSGLFLVNHSTTASAANAFINSGSSPVGQLLRSTSSEWYKTGIEDVEQKYLDAALSIRAVYYRSDPKHVPNDNPAFGHWGHIAEEVAAIDPRLVHWGYQERDFETYTFEVPAEVETGEMDDDGNPITKTVMRTEEGKRLKEGAELRPDGAQYERINVLKIEALKRKVEALEARLAKLEAA
ncbi:MAG: putative phage tail fiber protein [Thermomicrobiales bacterium]|nr:putative phage tail fiber protein [Thermomicrobiales bacterium]